LHDTSRQAQRAVLVTAAGLSGSPRMPIVLSLAIGGQAVVDPMSALGTLPISDDRVRVDDHGTLPVNL